MGLKVYQGIVSQAVAHFDFLNVFNLQKYHDRMAPVVLFGVYDLSILKTHKGIIVLRWCGNDARIQSNNYNLLKGKNIINITPLPKVKEYMAKRGVNCHLIKPVARDKVNPLIMGDKVYAYINHYKKEYHGSKIISQLNLGNKLLIGDFTVPTNEWVNGVSDTYYGQCFVGLFLSNYCGGGMGILEMGLRGIRVITNVNNLPHTIHWNTIKDIQDAIKRESINIGKPNPEIVNKVAERIILKDDLNGFDLEQLKV